MCSVKCRITFLIVLYSEDLFEREKAADTETPVSTSGGVAVGGCLGVAAL